MRRSISILLAAAMTAGSAVTAAQAAMPTPIPAMQSTTSDVIQVENNRESQWWYRGNGNRHGWRPGGWDRPNRPWHGNNHWHGHDWDNDNDGAALALGLFGFAAGAAIGSGFGGPVYGAPVYGGGSCGAYDAHDRACDNRFRSYDWCSNTYMGYDGYRHYC